MSKRSTPSEPLGSTAPWSASATCRAPRRTLIDRLIADFNPLEGRAIGVPTYRGKRGNPVLWAARFFGEIRNLSGDVGARHLIGDHADAVYEVESPDHSVTIDVDTPEALDALGRAAAR